MDPERGDRLVAGAVEYGDINLYPRDRFQRSKLASLLEGCALAIQRFLDAKAYACVHTGVRRKFIQPIMTELRALKKSGPLVINSRKTLSNG